MQILALWRAPGLESACSGTQHRAETHPPAFSQPLGRPADRHRGEDLTRVSEERLREIRGSEISMIFQEPMTSLTPVLTIGRQLTETIVEHQKVSLQEATNRAVEMLRLVKGLKILGTEMVLLTSAEDDEKDKKSGEEE